MYGIEISRESGLRTIGDDSYVFEHNNVQIKSQYAIYGQVANGEPSRTTDFYIPKDLLKNSMVAIEEGSIVYWNHRDASTSVLRLSTKDVNRTAKIHLFTLYPGYANTEKYGVNIRDKNQKLIYNSSLKTARVIGYISKNNPNPVWYRPLTNTTKLAFVQIGNDLSYRHRYGVLDYGKASIIECVGTNIKVSRNTFVQPPANRDQFWRSDYDVLWFILDISNL